MRHLSKISAVLTFFFLMTLASAASAFLLWLPSPTGRTNSHDPKSSSYVRPVPTPAPAPATFTPTPIVSPTSTPTQSPYYSPSNSPTQSPYQSPTISPTSSMTPMVTPTHGVVVVDMENNAANDLTLWNGGSIITNKDAIGSTISPNPWVANSGSAPGAYSSSSYSACVAGSLVAQNGGAGIFPYTYIEFELLPNGSSGQDTSVLPYSPDHGIQFDYKAGTLGVQYEVQLVSSLVTDGGYYSYFFTPADLNWHTQVIYFPDVIGSTMTFVQPSWGAYVPWDPTQVGAVLVKPVAVDSTPVNYNLCLDNLTFAVPTAVPTPTVGASTMIMDFENNTANNVDLAPFSQAVSVYNDPNGTTFSPNPWLPGSGSSPGSNAQGPASNFAGCISGVLTAQLPSAAPPVYPAASMDFLLAPSGYGGGGGFIDITPYIPNKRLVFDYKASNTTTQYTVQIVTANVTDYNFYQYTFAAPNTSWNTLAVNFPNASFGPKFSQVSWAVQKPWDPTLAGDITFKVVPVNNQAVPFGLCLDNLRFN